LRIWQVFTQEELQVERRMAGDRCASLKIVIDYIASLRFSRLLALTRVDAIVEARWWPFDVTSWRFRQGR
jgi:hypothetical protein